MGQHQRNKYEILIFPIDYDKSFLDLSQTEAQDYFVWFSSIKKYRLAQLCEFLFEVPKDCLREDNLRVIEMFLLNSISTIPKSKKVFNKEASQIPSILKPFARPDDYVLDKETLSICFDIGIFLGDLITKLDHKINWKLETNEEFADYGQPILEKSNIKFNVNPFRVAKNVAARIYEGRYTEGQIISFFNAWKKAFGVIENR